MKTHSNWKRALLVGGAFFAVICSAATTGYKYDALGRLRQVNHDNGTVTKYTLDAAGNRMLVEESLSTAAPSSLTVPSSSYTGNYSVSWTAGGTVSSYELWESTSSTFATSTRVYVGGGTSHSLAGHTDGIYYYRVRGCNGSACTTYTTGPNSTTVTLTPGVPPPPSVPASSTTGSYAVSWGAASGTVTSYRLYEANNASFSGEVLVNPADATRIRNISGKGNGSYYYRVAACNGPACSTYTAGANAAVVTLPPGAPPAPSVPASSVTGNYTVSWTAASGTVTSYRLYEATNASFSGEVLVSPTDASLGRNISGKGNGTYYYRVAACNGNACSAQTPGSNAAVVTLPPSTPAAPSVPASSNTGSYPVSWSAPSGTVTSYRLYEATNASFSGEVQVGPTDATLSRSISGKGNGSYYYRVVACNGPGCSSASPGAGPVEVALPPGIPSSISVPASPDYDGIYTISWTAGTGSATEFRLEEATNSSFSGATVVQGNLSTSFSTASSARGNGTFYYRVRACYSQSCSPWTGTSSVRVARTPSLPGAPTLPATLTIGNYFVNWTASPSSVVTNYELYEANNPSYTGETRVDNDNILGTNISGRPNGTYYYRVRACNEGNCSNFVNAVNSIVITSPIPPQPLQQYISKQEGYCSWTVNWQLVDGATYYRIRPLQGFNDLDTSGPTTSYTYSFCGVSNYSGNPNDYRPKTLKACNANGCSLSTDVP